MLKRLKLKIRPTRKFAVGGTDEDFLRRGALRECARRQNIVTAVRSVKRLGNRRYVSVNVDREVAREVAHAHVSSVVNTFTCERRKRRIQEQENILLTGTRRLQSWDK